MAIIFIDRCGVRMVGGVLLIGFHSRDPQRTMMQRATWDFVFFRRQATVIAAAVDSLLLLGSRVQMKSLRIKGIRTGCSYFARRNGRVNRVLAPSRQPREKRDQVNTIRNQSGPLWLVMRRPESIRSMLMKWMVQLGHVPD